LLRSVVAIALFHDETLDHSAFEKVALENLFDILRLDVDVPDTLGIHDHDRPLGALIQASGLVDPDFGLKSGLDHQVFQGAVDLFSSNAGTIAPPVPGRAMVDADKHMFAKNRHGVIIRVFPGRCARIPGLSGWKMERRNA
jgi:hypothetical protein